jgi:hypothetical protein
MKTPDDRRRAVIAALATAFTPVAWFLPTHAVSAAALDLNELMGWLAQTREGTASFVEERHVKGFDGPLESRGELSFTAPDRFVRRTLSPVKEAMSVQGQVLTLTRAGRSRTLQLDAAPEAAAIVEAIRGTLTGNGTVLQRHYRVTLSGVPDQWVLDLGPRDPQLNQLVREVQIRGQRGVVRFIEVWLAGGDRSRMTITPHTAGAAAPATASTTSEKPALAAQP